MILTPGDGSDRLTAKLPLVVPAETLEQAVEEARLIAENGDIILFSPAFASFSQYKNEYERNDAFMRLVEEL